MATFKELINGLTTILKEHPELANKKVYHASECGCWEAGYESPITVAIPVFTQEIEPYIRIVSDDDGYRTNETIADWEFIVSKRRNNEY